MLILHNPSAACFSVTVVKVKYLSLFGRESGRDLNGFKRVKPS